MNKRRSGRKQERFSHKQERFWRKMLSEQADSGQSVRTFCQEKRLVASAFFSWQRELKQRDQKQPGTATLQQHDAEQPPTQIHRQATKPNKEPRVLVPAKLVPVAHGKADAPQPAPAIEEQSKRTTASLIAREERYRLTNSTAVRVEIETDSGGESTNLDVELVDISQGGARLRSKTPVAEKVSLTMTIVPKGFSKSLSARAQVRWTTLAPKGCYWLGCSIEPRIPQALLDHLAANGILERRHESRREVSLVLPACWELDPAKFEVSILNISRGGLCLLISQDGSPGDRIRLTLPGDNQRPTYVLTTVCWQVHTDYGFVVGCSFCHQAGCQKLMHLADAQNAKAVGKY